MGKSARSRTPESMDGRPALTPRMRGALFVIAAVAAIGLALAGAVALAPTAPSVDPTPVAAPPAGPQPGATPVAGSEVQESAVRTPVPRAALLPAPPAPRVSPPLPTTASAEGGLVAGYPADLAGPADGSTILDTSVSASADALQFALRARSDASPEALRAQYSDRWARMGLAGPGPDPDAPAFTDSYSSVTMTVEATGTGSVYTIFGVLRAG
jgi:hypothetical protein